MNTCRWVVKPNSTVAEAEYCNKPVKYVLKLDDDGNKVRKYQTFCPDHQHLAESMECVDDWDFK